MGEAVKGYGYMGNLAPQADHRDLRGIGSGRHAFSTGSSVVDRDAALVTERRGRGDRQIPVADAAGAEESAINAVETPGSIGVGAQECRSERGISIRRGDVWIGGRGRKKDIGATSGGLIALARRGGLRYQPRRSVVEAKVHIADRAGPTHTGH